MRSFYTFLIAFICAAAGLGMFAYKAWVLGFPIEPNQKSTSWHVEAKLEFMADGKPIKLNMFVPMAYRNYMIVDENFISHGYGLTTETLRESGNRMAHWAKRSARGRQTIFYRALLYELNEATIEDENATDKQPKIGILNYKDPAFVERAENDPVYLALLSLIEELYEKSADEESFVSELFGRLRAGDNPHLKVIRDSAETPQSIAGQGKYILEHAGIPARLAHGVRLDGQLRNPPFVEWVEVFMAGRWRPLDMETGSFAGDFPRVIWWLGEEPPFELKGGRNPVLSLSVKQNTENEVIEAIWKGSGAVKAMYDASLYSLPIDSQLVFHVLLLVPLGALICSFLRQVVGIKTYGTFMPVLVAIAFRETQLAEGIIMFSVIVLLGLIFRAWFDRLQLLMVPRLTAILCVVVLLITALTMFTFKVGISAGLSISLFPMVILTMVIERISVTWEEYGARDTLVAASGSLLVAVIGYFIMVNDFTIHLMFTFPELLLVVMALAMLLGRYNGYKLTEYRRFRALRKSGHVTL